MDPENRIGLSLLDLSGGRDRQIGPSGILLAVRRPARPRSRFVLPGQRPINIKDTSIMAWLGLAWLGLPLSSAGAAPAGQGSLCQACPAIALLCGGPLYPRHPVASGPGLARWPAGSPLTRPPSGAVVAHFWRGDTRRLRRGPPTSLTSSPVLPSVRPAGRIHRPYARRRHARLTSGLLCAQPP